MRYYVRGLIKRFSENEVGRAAAALTYYLVFSLCPLLIVISTLMGLLDLDLAVVDWLDGFLPDEIIGIIDSYFIYISENSNPSLLVVGLGLGLYSIWRAVNCLMRAVNLAYAFELKRGAIHTFIKQAIITILIILAIVISFVLLMLGRNLLTFVAEYIPIATGFIDAWHNLRFVLLAAIIFIILAAFYLVSAEERIRPGDVLPGTIAALLGWIIVSLGFSYYVENFGSYSVLYGSLGAIIVLLLWLNLTATVLIMGAELNGLAMRRRKKR